MIKSLWVKFLILLLSISVISLSAAMTLRELIVTDFEEYLEGENEDRIYRVMATIEGSYERHSGWSTELLQENAVWALLLGYEINIFDAGNNQLRSTRKAIENLPPLMQRRISALAGFSPEGNLLSSNAPFTNYPLFLGGNGIGFLEIRPLFMHEPQGKETIFMMRSNRFLVLVIFVLGGLSVLLSFVYSRRMTEPIKRLTTAAADISEGDITSRVPVKGNDEISNLSRTFNLMAHNLEVQEALRRKLTS
jgi:two-component system sensor histidine kinase BaeS